jgi:hypothetical protein
MALMVDRLAHWYGPAVSMNPRLIPVQIVAVQAWPSDPKRTGAAISIPSGNNVYMGDDDELVVGDNPGLQNGFLIPSSTAPFIWLFGPEYTGPIWLIASAAVLCTGFTLREGL